MNRSWVRFPQAAQIRPPGSGWAFLYALTGRAAWCARGRRPAREIATREPAARSDRSRGPPWPRRRPRAPQPGLRTLRRPPHLWGRAAVCAGGRRPAREIATREPAARSGRSRGPPWPCHRPPAPRPGPAFCSSPVPSGPSGALHASGAWSLMCGWVRRLEARPGPAAAHGRCSLVLRTPPMWSGLSCWDLGALRCVLLQTSSIGGVFPVDF